MLKPPFVLRCRSFPRTDLEAQRNILRRSLIRRARRQWRRTPRHCSALHGDLWQRLALSRLLSEHCLAGWSGVPQRVTMSLPDSGGVVPLENIDIAISPDGKRIAYIGPAKAGRMLWVRDMKEFA